MKAQRTVLGTLLLCLIPILACDESTIKPESDPAEFSILYESYNDNWGTDTYWRISISEFGEYTSYTEDLRTGTLSDELSGFLSESEMSELKFFVIFRNKFFRLPENVGSICMDCGGSHIEVRLGDKVHRVGGSMIENEQYLNISRRLREIRERFETQG